MFKRFPVLLALVAFMVVNLGSAKSIEPGNLSDHKKELRDYVESGEYATKVADVALSANKYLLKRIARGQAKHEKMALVLDIDETAISNMKHMLAYDFGYVPKAWEAWVASGQSTAIVPVQIVYDSAVRAKIDVFFITGRGENDRVVTERNLHQVGYDTWTKIFYKPTTDILLTTKAFKTDVRRKLVAEGYVLIVNIGDQDSDLGEYTERDFKLPNPFYLTK